MQLAYVDQTRTLDGKKTVWDEISGGLEQIMVGKKEINSRAYLSSFNFRGGARPSNSPPSVRRYRSRQVDSTPPEQRVLSWFAKVIRRHLDRGLDLLRPVLAHGAHKQRPRPDAAAAPKLVPVLYHTGSLPQSAVPGAQRARPSGKLWLQGEQASGTAVDAVQRLHVLECVDPQHQLRRTNTSYAPTLLSRIILTRGLARGGLSRL